MVTNISFLIITSLLNQVSRLCESYDSVIIGARCNELSPHLVGGWCLWWWWWWWWAYGSEGVTCRRGIMNIMFHSSEANLFLNSMFFQVIFDLVSNQDSFWCSVCVIMLGPCWRRTLGFSSSPQETNVCHWQWWQECKVMEHVWHDVTSTNRLGSKNSFFRL